MSESGIHSISGRITLDMENAECQNNTEQQNQQSSYSKQTWDKQIEGLSRLSSSSCTSSGRGLLNANLKNVQQQYMNSITSLRSQVSGSALQAINIFLQNMGVCIDNELLPLLSILLTKLGETSKSFLVEDTTIALDTQARVSPVKRIVPLLWQSRDLKSAARQSGLAWFIYRLVLHQGHMLLSHLPRPQSMGTYNEGIVLGQQNRTKAQVAQCAQHVLLVKIQHVASTLAEDKAADARLWSAKVFLLLHILLDPQSLSKQVVPFGGNDGSPFEVLLASVTQDQQYGCQIDVSQVNMNNALLTSPTLQSAMSSPRPSINHRGRALSSPITPRPSLMGSNSALGSTLTQTHNGSGVIPCCNVNAIVRLMTSRDWSEEMGTVISEIPSQILQQQPKSKKNANNILNSTKPPQTLQIDAEEEEEDGADSLPEGYMARYRHSLTLINTSSNTSNSGVLSSRAFRPSACPSPMNMNASFEPPYASISRQTSPRHQRESPRSSRNFSGLDQDGIRNSSNLPLYCDSSDSTSSIQTPVLTPRAYLLNEKRQFTPQHTRTAPLENQLEYSPRLRHALLSPQAPAKFTSLNQIDTSVPTSLEKVPVEPSKPLEPQERKSISSKQRQQRTRVPNTNTDETTYDVK